MGPGGSGQSLVNLCTWVVGNGCGCHDCHNGLKWGMHFQFADKELLKDMHIIVESLRNAYGLLYSHLAQWLADTVLFVDTPEDPSNLAALWTALGVDSDWIGTLVSLGLLFKGGRLQVASRCMDSPDLFATLSGCLLFLWHFTKFTDSRWCTIGSSCRGLVIGLLTGVDSLAAAVLADPQASNYHISGVERLTEKSKHFALVAAFSSYPPEGVLAELMEDDRAVERIEVLEATARDE
eukprot:7966838-Alexandrium_andersonii.AAC.1